MREDAFDLAVETLGVLEHGCASAFDSCRNGPSAASLEQVKPAMPAKDPLRASRAPKKNQTHSRGGCCCVATSGRSFLLWIGGSEVHGTRNA